MYAPVFACWVLIAEFYLVDRGLRHRLPGFSSLDRPVVLTQGLRRFRCQWSHCGSCPTGPDSRGAGSVRSELIPIGVGVWSWSPFIQSPPSSERSRLFCRSGRLLILWSTTCNLQDKAQRERSTQTTPSRNLTLGVMQTRRGKEES